MDCDGILAHEVDNEREDGERKWDRDVGWITEREWDLRNDLRCSLPMCKVALG